MESMAWPILLLGLGLGLLVAEVFLPSGGMLGVLAATSLAASWFVASAGWTTPNYRWAGLEATLVCATWLATMYGLPRTRLGRRVYLQPPTTADLDDRNFRRTVGDHLGQSGRTLTPLRPSGMIDVDGRRIEAMAEFGLIEVGAIVTVIAVRSGRAIVRAD